MRISFVGQLKRIEKRTGYSSLGVIFCIEWKKLYKIEDKIGYQKNKILGTYAIGNEKKKNKVT